MQKYTYDLDVFYREDDISFYLLGALISDGCVRKNSGGKKVSLSSKDTDWLCIIRDIISPSSPITTQNGAGIITIYSTELSEWCIKHECIMKKSLTVKFPAVPDKYLPDFIRGCLDGDGCITHGVYKTTNRFGSEYYYDQYNCYICGSSNIFLQEMHNRLQSIGLLSSLCEVKKSSSVLKDGRIITPKNPHYRINFGGKTCYKFLKWLYYTDHKLSMPRKNLLAQNTIQYFETKYGTADRI